MYRVHTHIVHTTCSFSLLTASACVFLQAGFSFVAANASSLAFGAVTCYHGDVQTLGSSQASLPSHVSCLHRSV